ncbi:hypothetical protein [Thioalkalivibrio sp. ARh4]|nr:hypothetical protein [Thioalkalivibrio sp. ARh4]
MKVTATPLYLPGNLKPFPWRDGRAIASAGNAGQAWGKALEWALPKERER